MQMSQQNITGSFVWLWTATSPIGSCSPMGLRQSGLQKICCRKSGGQGRKSSHPAVTAFNSGTPVSDGGTPAFYCRGHRWSCGSSWHRLLSAAPFPSECLQKVCLRNPFWNWSRKTVFRHGRSCACPEQPLPKPP